VIPAILALYLRDLKHVVQPQWIKLGHLDSEPLAQTGQHRIESLREHRMKAPIETQPQNG